jgi:hypothetical protein
MSIYCPFCEALGIEATVSILDIDPYYGHFEESGQFIPWNKGMTLGPEPEETRRKKSLARMGSKNPMYGKKRPDLVERNKTNPPAKGKKISVKNRGKRGNYVTSICPHCGKTGGINGMTRWHFDNCKVLKNKKTINIG